MLEVQLLQSQQQAMYFLGITVRYESLDFGK